MTWWRGRGGWCWPPRRCCWRQAPAGAAGSSTTSPAAGFSDPASESTIAQQRIAAEVGAQDTHVIVLYTSAARPVEDPAVAGPVTAALAALRQAPDVAGVVSWYDTGQAELLSADRHATYATIRLGAPGDDEDALIAAYHRVEPLLAPPAAGYARRWVDRCRSWPSPTSRPSGT